MAALPAGLQAHIHRVRDIVQELAQRHAADPLQAALGALAHDVARAMPDGELLQRAVELGLPMGLVGQRVPVLLHGPVGAELLRVTDGLNDASLYRVVYWHTPGHADLDPVGQVVSEAGPKAPARKGCWRVPRAQVT